MDFQEIRYEVADGVLTITLNRPDRLNAFTAPMGRELIEAFDRADADDDVRVVIVTGAGRGFCAGADLGGGGDTFDWRERAGATDEVPRDGGGQVTLRIFDLDEAGDRGDQRARRRRRHHDDAADGHPPGRRAARRSGSSSRAAASCPRRARAGSCRASSASARRWSGSRPGACSLPRRRWPAGSCAACIPSDELLGAAHALAREIADNTAAGVGRAGPPAAVDDARRRRTRWRPTAPTRARCSARGQSADAREGVTSFLEKREPQFTDRVSDGLPELVSRARRARVQWLSETSTSSSSGPPASPAASVAAYLAERGGETGALGGGGARSGEAGAGARRGGRRPRRRRSSPTSSDPASLARDGLAREGGAEPRRPLHALRAAGDRGLRRRAAPTTWT